MNFYRGSRTLKNDDHQPIFQETPTLNTRVCRCSFSATVLQIEYKLHKVNTLVGRKVYINYYLSNRR